MSLIPKRGLSLSEPLVNIRFTLREAEQQGIITPQDHAALLAAAQSVFYPQRTYERIVSAAGAAVAPETRERFLAWVKLHAVDQKRKDAVAALEYIKNLTRHRKSRSVNSYYLMGADAPIPPL